MIPDWMTAYATRYKFRSRGPFEDEATYRKDLSAFLKTYDLGASFEVHVGRQQADWTHEDVLAFTSAMHPRALNERPPLYLDIIDGGRTTTTVDSLRAIVRKAFEFYGAKRKAQGPDVEVPILVHVIRTDGNVLVATAQRDDRLAVLLALTQKMRPHVPVYGFALTFDAFMHKIARDDKTGLESRAVKVDAYLAHIGTHDSRLLVSREYRRAGRKILCEPDVEIDMHDQSGGQSFTDPYAEVLLTVPRSDTVN